MAVPSYSGNVVSFSAAIAAMEHASMRFPESLRGQMSMMTVHAFSPSSMHSFLVSIAFDSRIPLSTMRASSMDFMSGGPASNSGEESGRSSAPTMRDP